MFKRSAHLIFQLTLLMLVWSCSKPIVREEISIVPRPASLTENEGIFLLKNNLSVVYTDESLSTTAGLLAGELRNSTGLMVSAKLGGSSEKGIVLLATENSATNTEGYELVVSNDQVTLSGKNNTGVYYAGQTVLQMVQESEGRFFLPGATIKDEPRFAWRGMHLDVSRHFFGVDKIKKYIDYLALYKLNTFHWHLTDDQGWRIEIKKYPLLTEQGAWRKSVGFASNQAKGLNEDNGELYGGFYTQEEVKEIVRYAQDRQVTIVPEIEMPGHTSAVLQAYPQLACEGKGRAKIWAEGGVSNNVFCAGKEETFEFLQAVLDEVLELFPSEYIHVGGDEAPKIFWEECSLCQNRISKEKLVDEHELQSYFITRMEKYLNGKGRKLIGWDEILEGGLAPNATVMSWRGEAGGIAAAQSGHLAVMTPGFPLYFNHRPIDLKNSPGHSSSNNTLTTVYNYEPVPKELTAEEGEYILGVQANLWTEYIPKWKHVESLLFPRILSLAEIAWTSPERKDFEDFRRRLPAQLKKWDRMGVNYGKDPYQVMISSEMKGQQMVNMTTELPGLTIRYTLDGTDPTTEAQEFSGSFACLKTSSIKAAAFESGKQVSEVSTMEYLHHLAIAKPVAYKKSYTTKYNGGGAFGLVDGIFGFEESIAFGWQGFLGGHMVATTDLGESQIINQISAGFLSDQPHWIFQPDRVIFEVSADGEDFEVVFDKEYANSREEEVVQRVIRPAALEVNKEARFVRVQAISQSPIPSWHGGAGTIPWIFADEIVVE